MTPVRPIDPRAADWRERAEFLRQLADRIESGEVTELAMAYNCRSEQHYATYGFYDDRWRMLGAFEHAKQNICN